MRASVGASNPDASSDVLFAGGPAGGLFTIGSRGCCCFSALIRSSNWSAPAFRPGRPVERHRRPALGRGDRLWHRPRPAAAHPDLARARLSHPRHDGRLVGRYQDYLYGRFDGINHEDEAQTDRAGNKISHGGDVYYMCPGTNYGKFLCVGVQRALDAGAEAIHLEEPEFWVRGGYSEGFKREWQHLLRRGLAAAAQLGGRPVADLQAQVLPLPPRLAAGVRLRAGLQPPHRPPGALLCAHAQPAQLRPLAHRQPGIQPGPAQRLRRLHRPGLDRHLAHAQPLLAANCASAPSRPLFWNTARCKTSSAPPAAGFGS